MTTQIKQQVSQISSFIDEAFNPVKIKDYRLLLLAGNEGLKAAVLDRDLNKYIAFEHYSFQNVFDHYSMATLVSQVCESSKLLKNRYTDVECRVANHLCTLVPKALFEEDRKKKYLKFNSSLEGDELIMHNSLQSPDAVSVFAVPFTLKSKLDAQYSQVKYSHMSAALISSIMLQALNSTSTQVYVHVQSSCFQVLVTEGKKLLFYNTFFHHTAEDFIYYLLFVFEQLQLSADKNEVILVGEIERTSTIFSLSQKYIRNIRFGERRDEAELAYQLQTFPRHYYFSVFNSFSA